MFDPEIPVTENFVCEVLFEMLPLVIAHRPSIPVLQPTDEPGCRGVM